MEHAVYVERLGKVFRVADPSWLKFGVTFLVPIAFAVTVPAEAVTSRLGWPTLALAAAFAAVLFAFRRWFWGYGLRSYTGASA